MGSQRSDRIIRTNIPSFVDLKVELSRAREDINLDILLLADVVDLKIKKS